MGRRGGYSEEGFGNLRGLVKELKLSSGHIDITRNFLASSIASFHALVCATSGRNVKLLYKKAMKVPASTQNNELYHPTPQMLVVLKLEPRVRAVTNPGAPLQALPPVEIPASYHVAGYWQGNRQKASEHLHGPAFRR
jgi:hypothetical protein